jgi:phosphoglycolate phosphatase
MTAVIFDLDGTLLDSLEDLADAGNRGLARLELPTHPVASYRHRVGDGIGMLARRALPNELQWDVNWVNRLSEAIREEYEKNWAEKTRPYPGVSELLDALAARGIPIAILTNKPQSFADRIARDLLGRWSFVAVSGARDDLPRKPDPTGALQVARQLEQDPANIWYLGDTDTDMATAVNARMRPVGVLWGFREREELVAHGALHLIAHPTELMDLIGAA